MEKSASKRTVEFHQLPRMKFLGVFLVLGVAMASASYSTHDSHESKVADKDFLLKQRRILDLLNHVIQENINEEQVHLGREYSIEANRNKYTKVEVVDEYLRFLHRGLIPKYKIFSLTFNVHRDEAVALFHLFFYAKDWETFYKTASWAREHVNEGIFVYALTVAVLHREDCRGIILPPPYEIYPFYFTSADVIQKANHIKQQGYSPDHKFAESSGIFSTGNNVYTIRNNFTQSFDYNDEEQKISYFTQDLGLNAYYYYFHADYPFWMGGQDFALNKDRRGELYYYVHQQLLARYYLERLSNGLGEIHHFFWRKPIKTGFNPNLVHHNGLAVPPRTEDFDMDNEYNVKFLTELEDYERRIRDAIALGHVTLYDGTILSLKKSEDIENLGLFVQGNPDLGDIRFYDYLSVISKFLLGGGVYTHHKVDYVPSSLEQFQTALRDPMFYQLYQRFVHYFLRFKDELPRYNKEDLSFKGVSIEKVEFTPLITYFEDFDFDITNAVYQNKEEIQSHREKFVFWARQKRLNHKSFSVNIDISSDVETDATVRMFLGPKVDGYGHHLSLDENRFNFVELDTFLYKLKSGKNVITRNNEEFARTVHDRTPTREVYQKIQSALTGSSEFHLDMTEAHNGWPMRLLLPKGSQGGMPYQVYVIVTPYRQAKVPYASNFPRQYSAGVGSGSRYYEDLPFGYPLDRRIDESDFYTSNMIITDVKIFHRSNYPKNDNAMLYGRDDKEYSGSSYDRDVSGRREDY